MGNYLIDFIDTAAEESIAAYFNTHGCVVKKHLSNLNKIYLVEAPTQPADSEITQWVINDDAAEIKLLSTPIEVTSGHNFDSQTVDINAEKDWWKLYSLFKVDFTQTHVDTAVHKTNHVIFLLDSGIKSDHAEFANRRIDLFHSFLGSNFNDNTGHGTALASVITGNTCAMLDCDLKVVKLFDSDVPTKQSDILNALNEIADYINNNPNKLCVLNMSWAIPKNEFIESKLRLIKYKGAALVASAGNSGQPITDVTPAGMNEVYTIGSYNSSFLPSDFSDYQGISDTSLTQNATNHGELDGWAPGESIYIATITPAGYGTAAGTSISAAIFSAGLLYNTIGSTTETDRYEVANLFGFDGIDSVAQSTLGREHLLDLSDPKYQACKNLITTYYSSNKLSEFAAGVAGDTNLYIMLQANKVVSSAILLPNVTKSYSWITPVPEWVYRLGEYIVFDIKTEPVNERDYYEFKISLTGNGRYDGVESTVTYKIMHLPSDFDFDAVPADDPVLEYQLQVQGINCSKVCTPDCPGGAPTCCQSLLIKVGCPCKTAGACA